MNAAVNEEREFAITFDCLGSQLIGVMHSPPTESNLAFVFVVGGPQYRVGSHRMFVELARGLSVAGAWVLRFDCRGMGDSDGTFTSFEEIADDIKSAIDAALATSASSRVVLVGLCDGASAVAAYAGQDGRVAGLVLMNPWVQTQSSEATARIRHYYVNRLVQLEFWRRLVSGKVGLMDSARSVIDTLRAVTCPDPSAQVGFIDRMRMSLTGFRGKIVILLSGKDLVAQQFTGLTRSSAAWDNLLQRESVEVVEIEGADHTFSGDNQLRGLTQRIVEACF